METAIFQSLIENSLVFGIMGVIIWWLAKRYEKAENDKSELAKDVIKLTVAYETKLDSDKEKDREIKQLLSEIRDEIRKWKE
jgi:hypothetical protein